MKADSARFAGRAPELAAVRELLDPATASRVLFVHGPGGIGKSALLRAAARTADALGYQVVHRDARTQMQVEPERLVKELIVTGVARCCYVIDEVNHFGSGLEVMRDLLLDQLPDSARLIVAGRRGPAPSWREHGLDRIVEDLLLRPLDDTDAEALLTVRGVDARLIPGIMDWAHGSPLALTIAATTPSEHPDASHAESLEQRITSWLVGQPILDVPPDVLEAAAFAHTVDARLLAAALSGQPTRDAMRHLAALPVAERVGDTVALHTVLAAAIRARVRASHPQRAAELVRRIAQHLATRARLGDMPALLRLSALLETPELRVAIGNEPSDRFYASTARPDDLASFGASHGFDRGPDWPQVAAWVEHWPQHSLLMRRIDSSIVMFSSFVPVRMLAGTSAIVRGLAEAAERTGADPDRSFAGVVMFADAPAGDIADAARLGAGAFMLQRGVGDMQSMLIHYPEPDRRPSVVGAIAAEVEGQLTRPVALSDFRPAGAVGTVEAMVLSEQGFAPGGGDRAELLALDDDPERIDRLLAVLDEVFGDSESEQRLRRAVELVHLGARHTEEECLELLHVSRRTWYRLLRTARERVLLLPAR